MGLLAQISQELEELVRRTVPSVVGVEHRRGQGTGVVLAQDGYVITNAHVVGGAPRDLGVRLPATDRIRAEVVGLDQRTDLAVMRLDASGLASLALADGSRPSVGQLVLAIGNPLHFERSVSLGVVSALDRALPGPGGTLFEGLIQTDAAINPGNSGGPLVDMSGNVVGINTAVVPFAQGIGFAVPAHTAAWVAAVLMRRGEVRRPILGVMARGEELTPDLASELGQARAVRVYEVTSHSPAQAAGLEQGDLVFQADGTRLSSIDDLHRVMVLSGEPEVHLGVLREHTQRTLVARPVYERRVA